MVKIRYQGASLGGLLALLLVPERYTGPGGESMTNSTNRILDKTLADLEEQHRRAVADAEDLEDAIATIRRGMASPSEGRAPGRAQEVAPVSSAESGDRPEIAEAALMVLRQRDRAMKTREITDELFRTGYTINAKKPYQSVHRALLDAHEGRFAEQLEKIKDGRNTLWRHVSTPPLFDHEQASDF